jgi:hypothetical protein
MTDWVYAAKLAMHQVRYSFCSAILLERKEAKNKIIKLYAATVPAQAITTSTSFANAGHFIGVEPQAKRHFIEKLLAEIIS